VWAFVAAMTPVRAWEPAMVFGIGLPLIVLLIQVPRLRNRASDPNLSAVRFGCRDIFLVMLVVGMSLGLCRLIQGSPSLNVNEIVVPAVSLASLGAASFWLAIGPRRIWAIGIILLLIPLAAFLICLKIKWLDDVGTLGIGSYRAGLSSKRDYQRYLSDLRVVSLGWVEFVSFTCAISLSLAASKCGQYSWAAKAILVLMAAVCTAAFLWLYAEMLPLTPFPAPFKQGTDHGAEVLRIAEQVFQLGPRKPDFNPLSASALPPATGAELNQLYYEVLPLLAQTNSMPFDADGDLTPEFFRQNFNRVRWLRELCICFDAECDEAALKGERKRAIDMAVANLRIGTMCCRNATSIEAEVGSAFLGVPFAYFARSRDGFSVDEAQRITAALTRVEQELEPVQQIQQRDVAYCQREHGWQGRLSEIITRGQRQRANSRAVQFSRDRWHAMSRLLLTDLAIRQFERQHGAWPENLGQLVPEYLAELPIDPYSGRPLGYLPGDDDFALYSVGLDRQDNGGRFSEMRGFYRDKGYDIDLDSLLE
jgi:hypothetical protein